MKSNETSQHKQLNHASAFCDSIFKWSWHQTTGQSNVKQTLLSFTHHGHSHVNCIALCVHIGLQYNTYRTGLLSIHMHPSAFRNWKKPEDEFGVTFKRSAIFHDSLTLICFHRTTATAPHIFHTSKWIWISLIPRNPDLFWPSGPCPAARTPPLDYPWWSAWCPSRWCWPWQWKCQLCYSLW